MSYLFPITLLWTWVWYPAGIVVRAVGTDENGSSFVAITIDAWNVEWEEPFF